MIPDERLKAVLSKQFTRLGLGFPDAVSADNEDLPGAKVSAPIEIEFGLNFGENFGDTLLNFIIFIILFTILTPPSRPTFHWFQTAA